MFSQVVESYSETLLETTVHSFEKRFSQIEGIDDDISIEITDYLREYYGSGPDFNALRKHLHKMFGIEWNSTFFSQLQLVFRESIMEGFSGVISSVTTTTTTTTTGGATPGGNSAVVEKTEEAKSMTLMEFSDVTMSSSYNNNQFPARNVLAEDNTFAHTDKGVGQFWEGKFDNGVHTITQVRIKNRADCCAERLSGTKIFIGKALCGKIPNIQAGRGGKWYTLECKSPIIGSSVRLVTTQDTWLHFTRIEVYGLRKQKLSKPQGASKFVA